MQEQIISEIKKKLESVKLAVIMLSQDSSIPEDTISEARHALYKLIWTLEPCRYAWDYVDAEDLGFNKGILAFYYTGSQNTWLCPKCYQDNSIYKAFCSKCNQEAVFVDYCSRC